MKLIYIIAPLFYFFLGSNYVYAQVINDSNIDETNFYCYWGYNRSWYADSNIHFNGPEYDITFYDLKATDRPSALGWDYINPLKFSIPQYNFRFGYRLVKSLFVSFGVDHMKYVVEQDQATLISGVISPNISEKYAGSYLNDEIVLATDLLKFEHTDGFNLVSIDFEYLFNLKDYSANELKFMWNAGLGGIWLVTKTNVKVLGEGLDNDFHIAGFTLQGKTGPRLVFKNKFFIQSEFKTGYASLPYILIKNAEPEQGDQTIVFFEWYFVAGMKF